MIKHREKLIDKFYLELVDGKDIPLTYADNSKVHSCMAGKQNQSKVKLYGQVPDLSMLRVVKKTLGISHIYLRALIWIADDLKGKKVKFLDTIYNKKDHRESHPDIRPAFMEVWKNFADVRKTGKHLSVEIDSKGISKWPWIDTFYYINLDKDKLYNYDRKKEGYITQNTDGNLRKIHVPSSYSWGIYNW